MEEDILSDVVPSNLVSRQVCISAFFETICSIECVGEPKRWWGERIRGWRPRGGRAYERGRGRTGASRVPLRLRCSRIIGWETLSCRREDTGSGRASTQETKEKGGRRTVASEAARDGQSESKHRPCLFMPLRVTHTTSGSRCREAIFLSFRANRPIQALHGHKGLRLYARGADTSLTLLLESTRPRICGPSKRAAEAKGPWQEEGRVRRFYQ